MDETFLPQVSLMTCVKAERLRVLNSRQEAKENTIPLRISLALALFS